MRSPARAIGFALVGLAALGAVAAPLLAPHAPDASAPDRLNAPPTRIHVLDDNGTWHRPFIYRWSLVDRLEQRYAEDRSVRVPIGPARGHLLVTADDVGAPLMLAGTDALGRDVFSRLLYGARVSLGLAIVAALGAVIIGAAAGAVAGIAGGLLDELLMRASELVLLLPAIYVALAIRAVLPLVLAPSTIFALLAVLFAVLGSPFVARGVRTIVASEKRTDYAQAALAIGATRWRLVWRHLLPATRSFLAIQLTVLVPAFIVAEATLSYVGLGFPDPIASWGAMLHDASNTRALVDFPWLLAPAVAIVAVVLGTNLILQRGDGAASGTFESLSYNDAHEAHRRLRTGSDAVLG